MLLLGFCVLLFWLLELLLGWVTLGEVTLGRVVVLGGVFGYVFCAAGAPHAHISIHNTTASNKETFFLYNTLPEIKSSPTEISII